MPPRTLPSLAVLLVVCATVLPDAQQLRKIGEMELSLVGLSATVDGARPAIPKNVASGVTILINGGGTTLAPAAAARLLGPFAVEAELSGPSFGETVTVRHTVTPIRETDFQGRRAGVGSSLYLRRPAPRIVQATLCVAGDAGPV